MATIRKRSGRWQPMIRRSGHPPISKTFSTKSDCIKWSRQLEAQIERDLYLPNHGHAHQPGTSPLSPGGKQKSDSTKLFLYLYVRLTYICH